MLYGRNRLYRTGKNVYIKPFHYMAQKKKRSDKIFDNSENAVKYNKIINFQGNPKKGCLIFLPGPWTFTDFVAFK